MITDISLEQEAFQVLLEKLYSENQLKDPVAQMRQKSWDHFVSLQIPSPHDELYRGIKLKRLYSKLYEAATRSSITSEEITPFIYPECAQSIIVFVNGDYRPDLSRTNSLPPKMIVSSLQNAMQTFGAFLNNHWNQTLKEEKDSFAALNGALHQTGLFLYLPSKTIVENPIQILHLIDGQAGPQIIHPRLELFAGAHAEIKIIFRQKHLQKTSYFVNQVSEFILEEGAHVQYAQMLHEENPGSWHLDAVRAILKRNSNFKTLCITEGSETIRADYRVQLMGENCEAFLNGLAMLNNKAEAYTNIWMEHLVPSCRSFQLFKNVLNDFSRSGFEGKIMVRQAAQKTEAFQLNNNLLIHDHAHASSKPNLEIFADDVKASHGATVGQLDQEQLFYLKTRGLLDSEAKALLIYGFCEQMIRLLFIDSVKNEIAERAKHYLKPINH